MSTASLPLAIVNYHYCHPRDYQFPGLRGVTPEELDCNLAALRKRFEIVSLHEGLSEPDHGETRVVVSFDDGLKDLVVHALPILKRHRIPGIFFVTSGPYEDGCVSVAHSAHILEGMLGPSEFHRRFELRRSQFPAVECDEPARLGIGSLYPHDTEPVRRFKTDINYRLPYPVVERILGSMLEECFGSVQEVVRLFYLSLQDITRCIEAGLELGIHSKTHRLMSRLSLDEKTSEVDHSVKFFRQVFNMEEFGFAYPYGIPGSYDPDCVQLVASNPHLYCGVTLGRRAATSRDLEGHWEIPRLDNRDVFERDGSFKTSCDLFGSS